MDEQTKSILDARLGSRVTAEVMTGLAEKFSGADLERVETEDGQTFVLKHLSRDGDWLTRATNGTGRMFRLWSSGLLDDVTVVVDHTVVDCVETPTGWTVVMRDASADLLPARVAVDRDTAHELLRGLAGMHAVPVPTTTDGLCSIASRYGLFTPQFHAHDSGTGQHPMREAIVDGWDVFRELVPTEVADAIAKVHGDPGPLGRALEAFPLCLLHGDAKLENLGQVAGKLVLIDWGDLTGFGPPEIDVAWFVLKGAGRITPDVGGLFADYEAQSGRKLDARALDLACIGSLAQMGFRMANSATKGRPDSREIGRSHLEWWSDRVRAALDTMPY